MSRRSEDAFRGPLVWSGHMGDQGLPDCRCCVLTGPSSYGYPVAGGDVDGVTAILDHGGIPAVMYGFLGAVPSARVQVEAGGSFSSGALLQTLADGRVVAHSSGTAVLRALQGGSAGALVWCVFTSGR